MKQGPVAVARSSLGLSMPSTPAHDSSAAGSTVLHCRFVDVIDPHTAVWQTTSEQFPSAVHVQLQKDQIVGRADSVASIRHLLPAPGDGWAGVQKVSKSVLDELKSVRSTSVALTTRVRKFKSELEDILSDDHDMCACFLSPSLPLTLRHALLELRGLQPMNPTSLLGAHGVRPLLRKQASHQQQSIRDLPLRVSDQIPIVARSVAPAKAWIMALSLEPNQGEQLKRGHLFTASLQRLDHVVLRLLSQGVSGLQDGHVLANSRCQRAAGWACVCNLKAPARCRMDMC